MKYCPECKKEMEKRPNYLPMDIPYVFVCKECKIMVIYLDDEESW